MLDLNSLNPQQRQAVRRIHGPVLVLAGAGSGKTRVITHRLAYMIERGVPPGNILAVTFTNKAAREMLERVNGLIGRAKPSTPGNDPARPTICTFHSLGVRILRQHIERLGCRTDFSIYNESQQLTALKRVISHVFADGRKMDPVEMLAALSRFRNSNNTLSVVKDSFLRALVQGVADRYESALRACNAVDFDDLILLPLRLFEDHPDVLDACRARYKYIMVDEYQDTNPAQFRMVHALASEHRNLCVVGDDDQSIYGWRGAEIANLLDMNKHFPDVEVIRLEENYRSTTVILEAANALIRNNARRCQKTLWSRKGTGKKIALIEHANEEAEARSTVEDIEFSRMSRGVQWSRHAIVFRTNRQSTPFEVALRQAGVAYRLVGGKSFFDRREVRDFLAYLGLFVNPNDDGSLLRIANVPARGLGDQTMQQLLAASQRHKTTVFAAMSSGAVLNSLPQKTRQHIAQFVEFVARTRKELVELAGRAEPRCLQVWADRFLTAIGYADDLKRFEKDPETAANRLENLNELVASLDRDTPLDKTPVERLRHFLDEITLDTEHDEEEQAGNAVTLITIHSCKGLEFQHVHLVGVEDGLLPHERAKSEGTIDEERRLFYVAITRAMETLTLSHCASRQKHGKPVPCHPSRFLKELPEESIEDEASARRAKVTVEEAAKLFAAMREMIDK